jgi:riboflavin synthase
LFTGLITSTARVISLGRSSRGASLRIKTDIDNPTVGESISVNGVCQTVAKSKGNIITFDVLPETLRVTNLGRLKSGDLVNVERALRADSRLGGHIVNGHVDGLGEITEITRNPISMEIQLDGEVFQYIVSKGSVAVDGISLTVGPEPKEGRFRIFIIPHTWESTNLKRAVRGKMVNIEVDIIAKYVKKFVSTGVWKSESF